MTTTTTIPHLTIGHRVRFATPAAESRNWWLVSAGDKRYTILTRQRPFRPKGELVYTIIDRVRGVRGPCNLVGQGWNVEAPSGCAELLRALQHHDERDADFQRAGTPQPYTETAVEVSHRNNIPVDIVEVDSGPTITVRHEGGNTLTGPIGYVLETHLAKGWSLADVTDPR